MGAFLRMIRKCSNFTSSVKQKNLPSSITEIPILQISAGVPYPPSVLSIRSGEM